MATPRTIQSVSTSELYDRWAEVYDTDGNILQAIDDIYFADLLKEAYRIIDKAEELTVLELGCGTGRNTVKLLNPEAASRFSNIYALDLSTAMISQARTRCKPIIEALNTKVRPSIEFHQYDALLSQPLSFGREVDLVVSTLVLEHLPIDVFFERVKGFLRCDGSGMLLLTNMHPEMGKRSQAGFLDEKSGEKIQGTSFAHEIQDVIDTGKRFGFELCGQVKERAVAEDEIGEGKVLGKRGYKWIGCKVWFGCLLRLEDKP